MVVFLTAFGGIMGSIVTGYFTLMKPKLEAFSETEKEYVFRGRKILEKISKDFEKAHRHYIELCLIWLEVADNNSVERKELLTFVSKASNSSSSLYEIEGRLKLLGLNEPAKLLWNYRIIGTKLFNIRNYKKGYISKSELEDVSEQLCQKKDELYTLLAKFYRTRKGLPGES